MTEVKLCGITNLPDAELCAEAGAWTIGLIFHRPSPRACEPEAAAEIGAALRRRVEVAGVFVNAPLDELTALADACSLSLVQLHGDEGPAYCAEVARRTGCRVIKAIRVRDSASVRRLRSFRDRVDFHLVDAHVPGRRGGTGETFAWDLVRARGAGPPLIVSGGITPDNAADAIAATEPFALDSASGTEAAPGRKDPAKVEALMRAVRQATRDPAAA